MFEIIGRFVVSHRRRILAVGLLALLAFAFLGSRAGSRLKSAGFTSPSAPSQVASDRLRSQFGGSVNFILVVTARTGSVDDPAAATAGASLAARLAAAPHVTSVNSYWTSGHPSSLRSRDGRQALVTASITGSDTQVTSRARYLTGLLTSGGAGGPGGSPAISVAAGGAAPAGAQIASQINSDLAKAEGIAVPVTLVLLLFAFGSVVAASLPLAIGVLSIFATLAVLYLLSLVTDVSVYALNLTTALGLGLGIDYSLLMVGRFREELGRGAEPDDAVVATVATAGRTIVFSGAAVAAALAALTVFPLYFLRSFAYAGMSVVAVAVLAALLVLPSILAVLGRRVNALPVPFLARLRAGRGGPAGGGESPFWRRVATGVVRHPVATGAPVVVLLVVLMIPFFGVHFGTPDDRVLPATASAHVAGDALRAHFGADAADTAEVITDRALTASEAATYSADLSGLPGVASVSGPAGVYSSGTLTQAPGPAAARYSSPTGTWLSAVIVPDAESGAAARVVHLLRAVPVPGGDTAVVGGQAAALVDQKHDLAAELPLAIALIVLTTFIVLWLFTGSVVLPLKALVLNGLSLTAVFGTIVWVFQEGHLSGLLGFTPTATSTTMPILLFCIAFGLSMDYEVFVLSRIKERHDQGVANDQAVVEGLARAGGIVSTAAVTLAVTFIAFGLSRVSFIQLFGIGTALAVILDATLIRGVLVPAFMRLAGGANWWSPAPLRALHRRIGISEA